MDIWTDLDRTWTDEQEAFFAGIRRLPKGGALALRARAGTGKTTTIVEALKHVPRDERALMLVYGSRNAEELRDRIPRGAEGSTFHSLCGRHLGKAPDFKKLWTHVEAVVTPRQKRLMAPIRTLVSLAQNLGVGLPGLFKDEQRTWLALIAEFGVRHKKMFTPEEVADVAAEVFRRKVADRETVDFDDYVYFVARDGVRGMRVPEWIFVDECQDTNPTQMLVLDHLRRENPECRIVLAGDPAQAIYGWRGAGVGSFERLVRRYGASVLPLTVTHRCARKIVEEAQTYVADIEAREDAPDGAVEEVTTENFRLKDLPSGTAILVRNNAPLWALVVEALDQGIPLHVHGTDISGGVCKWLDKAYKGKDPNSAAVFAIEIQKATKEYADKPYALELALDDVVTAQTIWGLVRRKTGRTWMDSDEMLADVRRVLDALVVDGDDAKRGLLFSTIHGSKGLEWDRVVWFGTWMLPSKSAVKLGGWHLEQENNLAYVAVTRARHHLTLVLKGAED